MRWLTNFYDFSFKWTATAAIGIHPTKAWLSQLVNFKNAIWTWGHFRRTICNENSVLNLEKMPEKRMECFRLLLDQEFPVEACWLSQTKEGQTEQIHPQTFDDPFFDSTGMIYMHWVPTGQTVNKEYYVDVLKEFWKRFRRKRPALFKLGQWHFHLDNTPVHNSILVTDYLTKMGIKTVPHPPYSPDLAPCDFWLFLSSETVDMRQLRRWKKLCRRSLTRSHKRISMGPSRSCWNGTTSTLQPEEITSKGSFMCVLSIKLPIRKSLETYWRPLVPVRVPSIRQTEQYSILQEIIINAK